MIEHNIFCAVNDALDPDDTCDCGADEETIEEWITALQASLDDAATKVGQQRKTIHELIDLLGRCAEFIEPYADVVDGDYGEPRPNAAMSLLSAINEEIA